MSSTPYERHETVILIVHEPTLGHLTGSVSMIMRFGAMLHGSIRVARLYKIRVMILVTLEKYRHKRPFFDDFIPAC
jgi:hypothetical protein